MRRLATIFIPALILISCSGKDVGKMAAQGDWSGILSHYASGSNEMRVMDICMQDIALAETGQLADKAFEYQQAGSGCIVPDWAWDNATSKLLSYLAFSMGHIAMAQKMAFEANVCSEEMYDPEAVMMLVRTNLIYGAWPVAEKYIRLLEKDKAYRVWAESQRRFLYDDTAVEADSLYRLKRSCIPEEDFITGSELSTDNLRKIIYAAPEHRNTVGYLGLIYLTDCDFQGFRAFLDEFYGTEALPELPRSFAEAACLLSEMDHGYWKTVGVSPTVYDSYRDFKKRVDAGLSADGFAGTYWIYVNKFINK